MALRANGNQFRSVGVQHFGATALLSAIPYALGSNYSGTNRMRNITAGQGITDEKVAIPSGCRHPAAWMMPQQAGALAARNTLTGSGTLAADALAVKLALADLSGTGEITNALASLIVSALASISGSGGITDANLQAFLQALANISGSGGATADLTGLAELIASISGTGTADASTLTAIGELAAALTVTGTGLSTANVGEAVWSALAAANDGAGTIGEKLNDAGGASNPWTEIIESGYTAAEILRIIAAVLAGKVSGGGTGVETFKGVDGTTDRVVSTNDADGNRTSVTLDGA